MDLATFLIQRACEKPKIANYLFWFVSSFLFLIFTLTINFRYASVECENNSSPKDKSISDMYLAFVKRLSTTLKTVGDETEEEEYRDAMLHLDKRTNSTSSCNTRSTKAIC